jgi:membrane protein YqaA with SNARE-associated domain
MTMNWEWLGRLVHWLSALGLPGLFAITFLDGAAIPVVGGPEAMTVLLAWKQPHLLPWIVLAAATGATLGALVFYKAAGAGGQRVLAKLAPARREWLKRQVARHAFWTLLVGVLLPPPFPTKPLVLTAGAVGTRVTTFVVAVFIGRVIRFSALAYVGFRFGEDAARVVAEDYPTILLALVGLVLAALITWAVARRFVRHPSAK